MNWRNDAPEKAIDREGFMPSEVVELRKGATEELAQWASEVGITPGALASQILRLAMPELKKAASDNVPLDSNVIAFAPKR
ncbi:hypothetical protein D3C84_1138860 [compost metagenome]